MRGHRALAWVSGSLPLEVLIDEAALHEIALRSAHRADDDFLILGGGRKSRIMLIYKKS